MAERLTPGRGYHYHPIVPEATHQLHCLTEGCGFKADCGPHGIHGHDSTHEVVMIPVDYTTHPIYEAHHARMRQMREAQRQRRDGGADPLREVQP